MILLFLILPFFAEASVQWQDVESNVLNNLPKLLSSRQKVIAQQGALKSAEGGFDHKIKAKTVNQFENTYDNQFHEIELSRQTKLMGSRLFLGQRQGTGFFPGYDEKYKTSSQGEIYAGLNLPVLRNLLTDEFRTNLEIERLELQIRKEQWRLDAIELLQKSFETYLKWITVSEKLKIYQKLAEVAEMRQTFFEKKFKAGDVEAIKLTDNQRSLSKRKAELIKIEQEWEFVRRELSNYYPAVLNISIEKTPSIQTFAFETEDRLAKDSLPQFKILNYELSQIKQKTDYYHSQSLPELNIMLEGSRDIGRSQFVKDPDQLRVGLQIEIPLENNKAEGGVTEQRSKFKATEYQFNWLSRLWQTQMDQIEVSINKLRSLTSQVEIEVSSSEKMSEAERRKLAEGDGDLFVVNIREQDEAKSKVKLYNTLKELNYYKFLKFSNSGQLAEKINMPLTQ